MSPLYQELMYALIDEFDFPWEMGESGITFSPNYEKSGPSGTITIQENDHGWMLEIKFLFFSEGMQEITLPDTASFRAIDLVECLRAELIYGTLDTVKLAPGVRKGVGVTLRRATQLMESEWDDEDGLDAEAICRLSTELEFLLSEADTVFEDISIFGTGEIKSFEALRPWRQQHWHT